MHYVGLGNHGDCLSCGIVAQHWYCACPVAAWYGGTRHVVAAVTVDPGLINPEPEAVVHCLAQVGIVVVELVYVTVVVGVYHLPILCGVVFWMLGDPNGVGGSVVWHPVKDYFHSEFMSTVYKIFKGGDCAVIWVNSLEVGGSIGAVDAASAWIDGH